MFAVSRAIMYRLTAGSLRVVVAGAALAGGVTWPGGAQPPRALAIVVNVVGANGAPIPNTTVTLVRGLNQEVVTGVTNRRGSVCLCNVIDPAPDYQLVARHFGFVEARQFIKVTRADSVTAEIVLTHEATLLDPAEIVAEIDLRWRMQYVDAHAIAMSDRPLSTAFDVVKELRRNLLVSPSAGAFCAPASAVLVDGRYVPARHMADILDAIKAEHVASLEYHDCLDGHAGRGGGRNAIAVALKAGVDFTPGVGSFVSGVPRRGTSIDDATEHEPSVTNVRGAAAVRLISRMAPYRYRIVGVFDGETGEPIEGVELRELATGTTTVTTITGTAALAFMRDGGGSVVLSKKGYQADILNIPISPRDTTPLTLVMFKPR